MKPRTSVILAVIAAIVLFAGWRFGPATMPGSETSASAGTLVFPNLAPKLQTAAKVEITHQNKTLVIARQTDGSWGLADHGGFRVQPDRLRELLTGLTELRITEPRTADPAEYARLGVEDPKGPTGTANLLRVLDGAGKPLAALIIGHRRVRTAGNVPETIYIRRPGEAQSWLAEGRVPVDADPQLWFDRDIANIPADKVASVTVTRGDAVLEFDREGGKPALKSPADHPKLDNFKMSDVFGSLDSLTLTDVKPAADKVGEQIGTTHIVGKDGLVVDVTVFKAGKDIWIQLAASGDGAAKAEAAALQKRLAGWTFQVGAWKEQAFVPTLDELKASEPARKPAP
ncbi:MAG: hypothetical protein ABS99_03310 [Acetobacteraceae bacterium SCN 69-10]|nr:MAG: hypothetical protein ABS99_03310 [Acetobacteraceae bacterium SCN 69-10]OJY63372.1 MAG: hypothetical protein BGP12_09960 [Rhodospirillales bacterium 70-18]